MDKMSIKEMDQAAMSGLAGAVKAMSEFVIVDEDSTPLSFELLNIIQAFACASMMCLDDNSDSEASRRILDIVNELISEGTEFTESVDVDVNGSKNKS